MDLERIIGFGSATWDFCTLVDGQPKFEATIEASAFVEAPGGQMGNTLRFLSRFGMRCSFRGHAGADIYGQKIVAAFLDDGVDVSGLTLHEGASSRVVVSFSDSQTGARGFIYRSDKLEHLLYPAGDINESDTVLLGECTHQSLALAATAQQQHATIWFLGGPLHEAPLHLLQKCQGVIVSREFVQNWRPSLSISSAFQELIKLGPQIVIVTDGEEGGLAYFRGRSYRFGVYPVQTLDTAGAGDAFAAGIIFAQCQGMPDLESLCFACGCAAINVQRISASSWPASLTQVRSFLTDREHPLIVTYLS